MDHNMVLSYDYNKQNRRRRGTTLMAISTIWTVIVMRRYYSTRIAQWRKSRAFIKATKHCHRASTHSDRVLRSLQAAIWLYVECAMAQFCREVATLHRGVTYQSDGKDLANAVEYLYWGAKVVS